MTSSAVGVSIFVYDFACAVTDSALTKKTKTVTIISDEHRDSIEDDDDDDGDYESASYAAMKSLALSLNSLGTLSIR